MDHKMRITLLGCCFLIIGDACSQDKEDAPHTNVSSWRVTLGIASTSFGPGFYVGASHADMNNVVTLRYVKADEFRFNVEGHYDEPRLTLKEIGFLYGRSLRKDILVVTISAGIGYIRRVERGHLIQYRDHERIDISTFCVPLEAAFRFEFGLIGVGGSWYGNLSTGRFISGAVLQVSIGGF